MPEKEGYNWGETFGTIATIATGNPYVGIAVNAGFNWVHSDKGTSNNINFNNSGSYNTGKLANNFVQAYSARQASKKRAQATQNAGKLDLGYLRAEAQRNGFNPLTVLRATGGQGSRTSADVGKMASAQFWQTFAQGMPNVYETAYDRQMKDARLQNLQLQNKSMIGELANANSPYRDPVGYLDPEEKLTRDTDKKRYFTGTEIPRGENLLSLTYDEIRQIPAEEFEEQYGDLAQIIFGVFRLGSDIIGATNKRLAIKKAREEYKRRKYKRGVGDRAGVTTKKDNLYNSALKVIDYTNKTHPGAYKRMNRGKLASQ